MSPRKAIEWISHRGYCGEGELENTVGSFNQAVRHGFHHLETDLRISKDKKIVLVHDAHLARLGGPAVSTSQLTSQELSKLRLRGGKQLLFFEEFTERYQDCSWTLDIKPEDGFETLLILARFIKSSQMKEHFFTKTRFLFWQEAQQKRFAELIPEAHFYAREKQCWRAGLAVLAGLPRLAGISTELIYGVPPQLFFLDLYQKKYFKAYREQGAKLVAFLPETTKETLQAVKLGFDQILTNHLILHAKDVS